MKITPKQYALSLYELIEESKPSSLDGVLKNFIDFLIKNKDVDLFDRIIVEVEDIWNEKEGIANVEVTSIGKLDKTTIDLLKDYSAGWLKKKDIRLSEKVDEKILGGFILKHKDLIVDGSLKNKLVRLKQMLEK